MRAALAARHLEQHVVGLEVAVHNGLAVKVHEARGHIHHEAHDLRMEEQERFEFKSLCLGYGTLDSRGMKHEGRCSIYSLYTLYTHYLHTVPCPHTQPLASLHLTPA